MALCCFWKERVKEMNKNKSSSTRDSISEILLHDQNHSKDFGTIIYPQY